jgi:pentatricopeptide repeat protein
MDEISRTEGRPSGGYRGAREGEPNQTVEVRGGTLAGGLRAGAATTEAWERRRWRLASRVLRGASQQFARGPLRQVCKCGAVELAREMFDRMPKRDITPWNVMILTLAIANHGRARESAELFHRVTRCRMLCQKQ